MERPPSDACSKSFFEPVTGPGAWETMGLRGRTVPLGFHAAGFADLGAHRKYFCSKGIARTIATRSDMGS